jgi:crotonobetainyl-CoA:carnitine CoA-transferase CaiB-like acyl-CoA transferase
MHRATGKLPLAGVRVLDLTQVVAGPYCTMMLADMGAEIVKIERPGHGDDLRRTVPYKGRDGHQDYFNSLNRSKKSVALDLKDPARRDLALKLAERADVMVENFSPGTVARLGLDWNAVRARNPRLVYCSLSGFGQSGPYRNRPALDPIIQAVTGIMSVTGHADGEPTMIGAPVADVIAGMFAAYAIVNALRLVTADGGGQYIDLSMQDAMLASIGTRMGEPLQAGIAPGRLGNGNPLRVPADTFRCLDGRYIAIMVHDESQWAPFCTALQHTEWIDDPRFRTMALRVQNRAAVDAAVAAVIAQHDSAYWQTCFENCSLPCALVNDYLQAAHRNLVRTLQHPVSGEIRVVGPPWNMSATEIHMDAPPLLGEHTAAVLKDWLGIETGNGDLP